MALLNRLEGFFELPLSIDLTAAEGRLTRVRGVKVCSGRGDARSVSRHTTGGRVGGGGRGLAARGRYSVVKDR